MFINKNFFCFIVLLFISITFAGYTDLNCNSKQLIAKDIHSKTEWKSIIPGNSLKTDSNFALLLFELPKGVSEEDLKLQTPSKQGLYLNVILIPEKGAPLILSKLSVCRGNLIGFIVNKGIYRELKYKTSEDVLFPAIYWESLDIL